MTGMLKRLIALLIFTGVATPALAAGTARGEVRAERVGLSAARLARLDSTIMAAIRNGAAPGAALAIGRHGEIVRMRGYGRLTYADDAPAVTDSTLFDLASLTKVVATTTAVMKLVDEGRLDLDAPIGQYLMNWPRDGASASITLRQLLTHTSGLPAGADLWTTSGREAKISRIAHMRLAGPPGMQTVYSDLGMIVTGAVVESVTGERLDHYLDREVFSPLQMRETLYNPAEVMVPDALTIAPIIVETVSRSLFFEPFTLLAQWQDAQPAALTMFSTPEPEQRTAFLDASRIAPTEYDPARGKALKGVVHDQTAAALDGIAGHAGLFSSARDLAVFAQLMLDASAHEIDAPFASVATVKEFITRGENARGLGWEMPSGRSSAGSYFPASAFGHTGFTGTSIWVDPEHDLFVVLLTNRVYPTAANQKHLALRRAVHDEVELAISDDVVEER
jgi:CubicO group peptidase (beta-lactamase class C family)